MATPGQSIELNDFKSLVLAGATEDPEAIVELAKRYSSKLMSYAESLGLADPAQATQVALITALKAVDVTKPPSENRFEAEMFRAVRMGSPTQQNGANGRTATGARNVRDNGTTRPPTIQAAGPIEVSAPPATSAEPAPTEPTAPPTIDPELLPPDFDPDLPPNPIESADTAAPVADQPIADPRSASPTSPADPAPVAPPADPTVPSTASPTTASDSNADSGGQTATSAAAPPVEPTASGPEAIDPAPVHPEAVDPEAMHPEAVDPAPVGAAPSSAPEPPRPPEPPGRPVEPDPTITADPVDDAFLPWTAPTDVGTDDEPTPAPPATDDAPADNERVIANDLAVDDGIDDLDHAGHWAAAVPGPSVPLGLQADTATTDEHPLTSTPPVFDQPTDPRPPSIDPATDPVFGEVAPAGPLDEQYSDQHTGRFDEHHTGAYGDRFEERPPEGLGVFDMPVAAAPDVTIGGAAPIPGADLIDTARYDAIPDEAADPALTAPHPGPQERPTSYAVTPPVVDLQALGHIVPENSVPENGVPDLDDTGPQPMSGLQPTDEAGFEPGYGPDHDTGLGITDPMPTYQYELDPVLDPVDPEQAEHPGDAGTIEDLPFDPDGEVLVDRRQPYVERRAPRERSRSVAPRGGPRQRTERRYGREEEDIGADPDANDNGRMKLLLLAAGPALLVIGLTVYLVTIQSDSLSTRAPVPADGNLTATTTEPDEAGERATFGSSEPSTVDAPATTEPGDATEPNVATSVTVTVEDQAGATGGDFSGETLANVDLAGTDLAGADFSGSSLTNVDLSDADLTSADFTDAILTDVNFERADISGADFTGATQIRSPVNGRWNPNDPPTLP